MRDWTLVKKPFWFMVVFFVWRVHDGTFASLSSRIHNSFFPSSNIFFRRLRKFSQRLFHTMEDSVPFQIATTHDRRFFCRSISMSDEKVTALSPSLSSSPPCFVLPVTLDGLGRPSSWATNFCTLRTRLYFLNSQLLLRYLSLADALLGSFPFPDWTASVGSAL